MMIMSEAVRPKCCKAFPVKAKKSAWLPSCLSRPAALYTYFSQNEIAISDEKRF